MTPSNGLRRARLNRGLSVSEAAGQMGVDNDALRRAESGNTTPHPRNALKIAAFYGRLVTEVWPLEQDEDGEAA